MFDQEQKSALIQRLTIAGAQDATPIIRGQVTNPMKLDLSGGTNLLDPSSFDLQVTNFNLADWRAFIGDVSGTASFGTTPGSLEMIVRTSVGCCCPPVGGCCCCCCCCCCGDAASSTALDAASTVASSLV